MNVEEISLPGLNCGQCGFATCAELKGELSMGPHLLERCIHRETATKPRRAAVKLPVFAEAARDDTAHADGERKWLDSLDRPFDFFLERFPEEPGPREIILPHNPLITREMDLTPGDILIGRPLGMSCGCPITHCGVAMAVDKRTGVVDWCVTGPLNPREKGFKDIGYYIAEGYEGLITESRCDIRIGMRYFFQPRLCMLQWRHSGLVNYLNRIPTGLQVRVEGLWIG